MPGTAKEWENLMQDRLDVVGYAQSLRDRSTSSYDEVARPEHYNSGGIECIEAIKASMSPEEFKGYLKGNALKYLWRYSYKGKPKQDLEKAQWYLSKLIAEVP